MGRAFLPLCGLFSGVVGLGLVGLGVVGCAADFLPASVVVNQRVIAIRAEPPEAVPGQQVTLTPTVVSPLGDLVDASTAVGADASTTFTATWWRCPDSDSDALGDFDQCTVPSARTDIASGAPYVDTVPSALFGALPAGTDPSAADGIASDKLLGVILGYWRVVGLTMTAGDGGSRSVDAFKRIPVYLPVRLGAVDARLAALDSHVADDGTVLPPNANPTVSAVLIHEDKVNGPTKSKLAKGKTYFFSPIYDERTLEQYISLKVNLDGLDLSDPASLQKIPVDDMIKRFQKVQRCEIPTFTWFVTAGRVRRDTTLDEGVVQRVYDARGVDCPPVEGDARAPEAEYALPTGDKTDPIPKDGVVHGWVVMRDGRGGTAVRAFDFTVE